MLLGWNESLRRFADRFQKKRLAAVEPIVIRAQGTSA